MASQKQRTTVFVSYSHQDSKWLEKLQIHLKPLERDYGFDIWDDTKIKPGSKWRQKIKEAIDSAKIGICLVSADFLASNFVKENELPPLLAAAEQDGAIILSIILSPCMFEETYGLSQF